LRAWLPTRGTGGAGLLDLAAHAPEPAPGVDLKNAWAA